MLSLSLRAFLPVVSAPVFFLVLLFSFASTVSTYSLVPRVCLCLCLSPSFRLQPLTSAQHIGEILGKGAFGSVFKGLDMNTGAMVAIKQVALAGVPPKELKAITVRTPFSLSFARSFSPCIFPYLCHSLSLLLYVFFPPSSR